MGKTYEALQRAEREFQESYSEPSSDAQLPLLIGSDTQASNFAALKPFDDLRTNLISRYPSGTMKSILFNGISHGGGCSTTTLNFAYSLVNYSSLKVLLIDANLKTPILQEVSKNAILTDLSDLFAENDAKVSKINKVGPGNLYLISCQEGNLLNSIPLYDSSGVERFLRSMYDNFDYIILDAPPVLIHADFRVLCSKVDGVVLVLESGRARRQVAIKAKKEIEDAGGRILGVVINKRKYYIPQWVYKRL